MHTSAATETLHWIRHHGLVCPTFAHSFVATSIPFSLCLPAPFLRREQILETRVFSNAVRALNIYRLPFVGFPWSLSSHVFGLESELFQRHASLGPFVLVCKLDSEDQLTPWCTCFAADATVPAIIDASVEDT